MAAEESRSIMYVATLKLDHDPAESERAATAAKVKIGQCGRFVGQNSIQLHGGMGMTDEMQIGHYFKRLTMIDTMFGNHAHHLKRYAAM